MSRSTLPTPAARGKEVVQLYVRDLALALQRPEKELKASPRCLWSRARRGQSRCLIGRDALAY